jgi:phosphoribosylaminoimidazolecarboxamide formyltransferase / IMP cyclohydrolase
MGENYQKSSKKNHQSMKIALLSVYNKEGIVEFAKEIQDLGFKILASGGTAKVLADSGIEVQDVASLTGGGAILGHRVVTLSREIYAGLLSRDNEEDNSELEKLKIPRIDLVCVDLYPLEAEILSPSSTPQSVIEKTDIGGPTLLRAAAKGRRVVICDPADRMKVVEWLKNGEPEKEKFLDSLAAKAEFIVAKYALSSARYHSNKKYDGVIRELISESKYGENGWQVPAALYGENNYSDNLALSNFRLVSGTQPSYNNWADVDRLLQTATHIAAGFDLNFAQVPYLAVGVKHGNACGVAVGDDPSLVIKKMLEGDLRAIFGGLVLVNFEIDEKLAEVLLTHKMDSGRRLLDGIIAPSFTTVAIDALKRKGDKCRFLVNPGLSSLSKNSLDTHDRFRYVRGGFLKQPNYTFVLNLAEAEINGNKEIGEIEKQDIILAWAVGSTSNSNTVTIVKDGQLLGNGVGQQDRVGGCELAIKRAKDAQHNLASSTAYSDSFFPFPDGPKKLIDAGIKTIFATRGSVKDEDVKKVCVDNGAVLITLPDNEARGFFGH